MELFAFALGLVNQGDRGQRGKLGEGPYIALCPQRLVPVLEERDQQHAESETEHEAANREHRRVWGTSAHLEDWRRP